MATDREVGSDLDENSAEVHDSIYFISTWTDRQEPLRVTSVEISKVGVASVLSLSLCCHPGSDREQCCMGICGMLGEHRRQQVIQCTCLLKPSGELGMGKLALGRCNHHIALQLRPKRNQGV